MTEQQTTGPRVDREQVRDLSRLRRSSSDRYVAGVAGGLGRHLDVDPTIIRVLLVVATFFGGAGLLVYAAVWLFVPEDVSDHAIIRASRQTLNIVLVGTLVIAACILLGTPFTDHGWVLGFPFPLLVVAVIALVVYSARRDRAQPPPPPPAPWAGATTPPPTSGEAPMSTTATDPTQAPPPAWMPPPAPVYVPPPRPRRTGLVLFWPTLALVAIALGTLGVADVSQDVPASAYAALALAVVAMMLLVGAFVGRPGGLIALGLVGSLALGITSAADSATGGDYRAADRTIAPTSAAAVSSSYSFPNGDSVLDLTQVSDLAALDDRTIDVSIPAGQLTVIVPAGLHVEVDARMRYAGDITLDGEQHGGFDTSFGRTLPDLTASSSLPSLDLNLSARFGSIRVLRG